MQVLWFICWLCLIAIHHPPHNSIRLPQTSVCASSLLSWCNFEGMRPVSKTREAVSLLFPPVFLIQETKVSACLTQPLIPILKPLITAWSPLTQPFCFFSALQKLLSSQSGYTSFSAHWSSENKLLFWPIVWLLQLLNCPSYANSKVWSL